MTIIANTDIRPTDKFDLNVINENFKQLDDRTKTEKRVSKMSINGLDFSDVTWTILKEKDSKIVRAFADIDIPNGVIQFDQSDSYGYLKLSPDIRIYNMDFIMARRTYDCTIRICSIYSDSSSPNTYQHYIYDYRPSYYTDENEPWIEKTELNFKYATIFTERSSSADAHTIKIRICGEVPN